MAVTKEQLKKLQEIHNALKSDRDSEKKDNWDKIVRYVLPELAEPSERKKLYSSAAQRFTSISANALQGWAYGRSISWLRLTLEDGAKNGKERSKDSAEWFQSVERLMLEDLSRSSFYDEAQAFTKVVLNLSTGIMLMDWDDKKNMFITENLNPRKCTLSQGDHREPDALFVEYTLNKDEAIEAFGEDKLPKKIQDSKSWVERWNFVKCICRSTKWELDIPGEDEWCEIVWCEEEKDKSCSERRLDYKPFLAWRFERSLTGSPWGVGSPGETALADITALNVMEKSMLKGIQLRQDPPIKATEGLELNLTPSGITWLRNGEDFAFIPPPSNTEEMLAEIQKKEASLKESYYVDFFLVLQQTMEKNKTATEAALLADEKSQIMASFTSRLNNEFLEPLLETLFSMEMKRGRLPEPPEELAGKDIKIDYVGPLSIAQKKAQSYVPARQFIAETMQLAEVDPSVKYLFDVPKYASTMARDLMIDERFINDEEKVKQMVERDRAMAEQQMQMAQQRENAKTQATAYQGLSKAPEEGSVMQKAMGTNGGVQQQ